MGKWYLSYVAAFVALVAPAVASAASVSASPKAVGKALILLPTTVTKVDDMEFGLLSVTTAGTAVLNSSTDTITTTGGVLVQGGTAHAARFIATSPAKNVVKITLPNKPITLKRVGGAETMTLDTWNINGALTRNVVAKEQFEFRVGGTLHVNANQVEGVYTGTFDVSVNYN